MVEATALGGQAASSRRIENYLGFPAGISGTSYEPAVTQARKFSARTATPYRAVSLDPGTARHVVRLEEDHEVHARTVLIATGAQYRRLPVEGLSAYEGLTVFYAAGPPEAQLCGAARVGVVGGGNSAGQAAVWLAAGVRSSLFLHRRGDLRETMSDYLIHELEQAAALPSAPPAKSSSSHGNDGNLEAVTLSNGERVPFSFLFLFLGASSVHGLARRRRRARRATDSSSPARTPGPGTCSRRAFPASSRPATSAPARRSAARRRSVKARWPSSSCMRT